MQRKRMPPYSAAAKCTLYTADLDVAYAPYFTIMDTVVHLPYTEGQLTYLPICNHDWYFSGSISNYPAECVALIPWLCPVSFQGQQHRTSLKTAAVIALQQYNWTP
jgi:hypothetical protein